MSTKPGELEFHEAARGQTDYSLAAESEELARFRRPHGGSLTIKDDGRPLTTGSTSQSARPDSSTQTAAS